ncbi:hypothetical protein GWK47_013351 [Chionoecetes opilio]|uniref:Major facilitator superfamily (MFS) profile domain-containing protein n=1 Tax=Chionoecetes opilio TaxID=41210 RepID=A0A8J5CKH3_CHIOP|nr:hypothetical protein GWK47_013351 [Chionoecetes opilio]
MSKSAHGAHYTLVQEHRGDLDIALGALSFFQWGVLCRSILLSVLVDRIGRRWSLMASFTIMAAGYTILALYLYFFPSSPQLHPDLEISVLSSLDGNATALYLHKARCEMPLQHRS